MKVDEIKNGIVIDHIPAGRGMQLYELLELEKLDCHLAIIKNALSRKMGKKDIIKIDSAISLNVDIVGYIAPTVTINIIREGVICEKKKVSLPETLTNVIKCKNPRCITSTEQELDHKFKLTDRDAGVYRCIYCETKAADKK